MYYTIYYFYYALLDVNVQPIMRGSPRYIGELDTSLLSDGDLLTCQTIQETLLPEIQFTIPYYAGTGTCKNQFTVNITVVNTDDLVDYSVLTGRGDDSDGYRAETLHQTEGVLEPCVKMTRDYNDLTSSTTSSYHCTCVGLCPVQVVFYNYSLDIDIQICDISIF